MARENTSFPGSFIPPVQSHVLVTNLCLWEGSQFFQNIVAVGISRYKTDLLSRRANLKSSFLIAQQKFTISTIIPSTFETGSGN